MSVHAASWAWKQKVGDAGAKLVLMKLADQSNDRGECWPSQKTLADECEMSRRTVQRKLETLYALGFVECEQRTRATGGDTSLLYRIKPPAVRQSDAPPYDTGDAPPTTLVTHHEPSLEPTPPSEDGEGDADAPRARDEIWEILEETFGAVADKTQAHGRRNKAAADLKRLAATADSIRHALVVWPQKFAGATVTDIALATHFPQLTTGYTAAAERAEPEPIDEAQAARAQLSRAAGDITYRLKQGVCPECSIGGGKHTADCAQAKETPRRAYRRFIEETADFPLADVDAVISTWRDLDDVERQEFRELAEHLRNDQDTTQEAA